MMSWIFNIVCVVLFSQFAFAGAPQPLRKSQHHMFPNTLIEQDFFVKEVSQKNVVAAKTSSFLNTNDCRANIQKVICLVDPAAKNTDPEDRPCLPGGQSYAHYFESLYNNYPPALQKMFCSLRYLFIEKEFTGTAYAGALRDKNGELDGAMMGIRKSVLDENLNLQTWASWKEQLSFGGIKESYTLSPELPLIQTVSKFDGSDFLYFVVTHEFGHIFDFANNLNKTQSCPKNSKLINCFAEGTWGQLSWLSEDAPRPHNEFLNRDKLCFYWCGKDFLTESATHKLYYDMWNSEFLSTYATRQAWDDFADSLAYYLMDQKLNMHYGVYMHNGPVYDTIAKLLSESFAHKYNYITEFLNRTDIVYP